MEEKRKVGRPKLANNVTKKKLLIITVIALGMVGMFFLFNNDVTKLSGKAKWNTYDGSWGEKNSKIYKKLKDKKVLMFGTSIGLGRCTYTHKNGDCNTDVKKKKLRPFIKLITNLNDMKLTNYANDMCGGVYDNPIENVNGYFKGGHSHCHGVMEFSGKKLKKYDFIIIEGFANDVEHPVKVKKEVFSKELSSALSYLKRNKKSSAIVMVVQTPKLPDIYSTSVSLRERWTKEEAKDIAQLNGAFYCSTYSVNAHYTKDSKDHPTYNGHREMAEIVESCMIDALDGKKQQSKLTITK